MPRSTMAYVGMNKAMNTPTDPSATTPTTARTGDAGQKSRLSSVDRHVQRTAGGQGG